MTSFPAQQRQPSTPHTPATVPLRDSPVTIPAPTPSVLNALMDVSLDTLTQWLAGNPLWILLAIAVLAFLESLALVGIIVPGIALLLAAATAAGSTGIPVWEVLLAGFIGAVLGDGLSFLLGYHYHHVIRRFPPFTTHPHWVDKGERFFHRYGLAGIVLGRFVGPIRPVMPLVAGLMEMPPAKFFTVNILSALAWSPFYLMPGYLVGLSIEGPNALDHQHLVFLLGIFLSGWLLAQFAQRAHSGMHQRAAKQQLALAFTAACALLLVSLGLAAKSGVLQGMNASVAQWVFGLRHIWLDAPFIGLTILGEYRPMVLWAALVTAALLWQRNFYAAGLWAGFTVLGQLLMEAGKRSFAIARPALVVEPPTSLAYPSGHTAMMLVFVGLLASLLLPSVNARRHSLILSCVAVPVLFAGAARLYLGVHWLSDIIGGLLLGTLVLALFYQLVLRRPFPRIRPLPLLLATALAFILNILLFVLPDLAYWTARYQPL